MEKTTLEFPHNARRTYAAVRNLFEMKRTKFSNIKFDDGLFVVEARHGAWLSPFSEKIKVCATSSTSCNVVIESSSRSLFNWLNFGANKGNVSNLSDYINNEVYKLTQSGEIKIVSPTITFR